ncbi:hypothetical protein KC19_VG340500 [Ceratodon purpureus]|uniref:Myb/SANT-like DNA-binding domain-containing protein n=1 Tax=Ceratodon purpureus TaxID=3225 RepID=A0A8T0HYC9_CERPU|nr:hypothetical protein KC19_VG340500 [Ceratodon purpureus]
MALHGLPGILGLFRDGEGGASSTSIVVHTSTPPPPSQVLAPKCVPTKKRRGANEPVEGQAWSSGAIQLLLDLYKEKYLAIGMGNMKKGYWVAMCEGIRVKFPRESLRTWEQTKSKWQKMRSQYYKEKAELGTCTQASAWHWYVRMDDILAGTAKADGVPQGMDMGEDIGTRANPQELDDDNAPGAEPTSPATQVPAFGEHPRPPTTSCASKEVGGAPNKRLKTATQAATEGATIIAAALGKFAEASSKIEVMKMEASKEIALKMIELDDRNAERQLQIAQLFAGAMRQGNGSGPSTS